MNESRGEPKVISAGPQNIPLSMEGPRGFGPGMNEIRNENGDNMEVEVNGGVRMRVGNITAHSDLNITAENDSGQNRTRLRVHFPNGMNAQIKNNARYCLADCLG